MSETADLLEPFDEEIISMVASRSETSETELQDLLVQHQKQVRNNPGVEDIVYEWRSQFHEQPVLQRTDEAYYLRLRTHVWDEFADALDIPEVSLIAMMDVHEEQARKQTGGQLDTDERFMILTRD